MQQRSNNDRIGNFFIQNLSVIEPNFSNILSDFDIYAMNTARSKHRRSRYREFLKELFYGFITEYETPKIVMIRSYTVTSLLRIMQVILLLYSIFYLLLYEKGYQKQDTAIISSITLKVKGIGYTQTARHQTHVIDGADYIIPASENNAIFIMTNFIETDQNRSQCSESTSLPEARCRSDIDCQNKPYMQNANGRWTGRCILPDDKRIIYNETIRRPQGICEMQETDLTVRRDCLVMHAMHQGWCPVEDDLQEPTFIKEIRNFTIFIKNFIEFPTFNVKHKNMVENLRPCVFHPIESKDCPIFRLDYIIREAEKNATEQDIMLRVGGVIRVKLDWDCNLDRRITLCKPVYSFARLDTPSYEEKFSLGFNFRFAYHWKEEEIYSRSLKKAFGLRLIVSVSGKAGKFDFITLTLNTGSLVGIFGLATFFCDIILLHLSKKASVYRDFVFQRVDADSEAQRTSRSNLDQHDDISMIFVNPTSHMRVPVATFHLPDLSVKHSNVSDYTQACSLISAEELHRYKPSLGLSNSLH